MIKRPSLLSITSKDIKNAFAGFGEKFNLSQSHSFYQAQYWLNPVLSPYFADAVPNDQSVESFKKLLHKNSKQSPYIAKSPYCIIFNGKNALNQMHLSKKLEANDWQLDKYGTCNYLLWNNQIPLDLPKGFHAEFSKFGNDLKHVKDFFHGLEVCFKASPDFKKYLNLLCENIADNVYIALIKSANNKLASIGLVCVGDGAAFLFCGGVMPRFRGKNLWIKNIALRQMITAPLGVKLWVCTSQNPRIMHKGDLNVESLCYTQKEKLSSVL